jgi:hypothetical protein
LAAIALAACGGGESVTGPAAESCGTGPFFGTLPVALGDIEAIPVFGGLGAPGHTLPTAHTGFYLLRVGAPLVAPAAMQITGLRRVRYLVSPNRQGVEDYTIEFRICREVSGWFGHVTSLSASLSPESVSWGGCSTGSTAIETIESCRATPTRLTVEEGDPLGTGGHSIELGLMGLDFGLTDSRVNNFYVARWRHPDPTFHAICPWDQFAPALRDALYAKLVDKSRPVQPAGEPRCGTMEVDVAGTARGVWAEPSETSPLAGNETRYIALANYPYRPQDQLALSLGPTSLGAVVAVVPRQATGRVNRPFEDVRPDGLVYCYGPDPFVPGQSWLLSMTGPEALTLRRVQHAAGASPCLGDPQGWSVNGGLALVR